MSVKSIIVAAALALVLVAGLSSSPASSRDESLRKAIESRVAQLPDDLDQGRLLQTLFAHRNFDPLFVNRFGKPTPQALSLLGILRNAESYGLRTNDYFGDVLAEQLQELTAESPPDTWADFDVELTAAALHLIRDLHYGRVDPGLADFNLGARRVDLDLAAVLEQLATAGDVNKVIAAIEPQFYHYRLLKQALARYRILAEERDLSDLPRFSARSIKPGDQYAGAPKLRKLLVTLGDLSTIAAVPDDDLTLDPASATALKQFQERHGLSVDGAIGAATFAALTTPLAQRVRQIELTLERWRWLPVFDTPPIIVNIPQFRLFAFQSTTDRKADIVQMDVIVGQAYRRTRTPVFVADMKYVVFRPYWDVPYSIMKNELLPKIRQNPSYLEEQHLEMVRGQSDAAMPVAASSANLNALASGELRLRQRPGADNALGLIKFMLPNAHNVYLHSTPAKELFNRSRRTFSHGCIRVSDPVALASEVLRNASGTWTPVAIEAAMNGATTQRVNLLKPVRVMILYGTAMATEAGKDLFFDDVYGYDRKLESLLGLGPSR